MEELVNTIGVGSWADIVINVGLVVLFVFLGVLLLIILSVLAVLFIRRQIAVYKFEKAGYDARSILAQAKKLAEETVEKAALQAEDERLYFEHEFTKVLQEDRAAIKDFLAGYHSNLEKNIDDISHVVRERSHRAADEFDQSLVSIEKQMQQRSDSAKQHLDSFTEQSNALLNQLSQEVGSVKGGITQLIEVLQRVAEDGASKNTEIINSQMNHIGTEMVKSLDTVAKSMSHTIRTTMENEIREVSRELSRYREIRVRMVDEQILALVEDTTEIALQKKLSVQDQAELVYRSLEEAKERGIFG